MKAVLQDGYGSPADLRVGDVPVPVPGDDEVLVAVRAASLHPDVWHVVAGHPFVLRLSGSGFSRPKNPVPGTDMAGIVESVGRNVTAFVPGDEVFGETIPGMQWVNGGAFAEYAAVSANLLASKPANVTFEQAASVPASGYIVLQNLRGVGDRMDGKDVLINGAGGGTGMLALQILRSRGARIAAVDRAGKFDMLRSLGADRLIDFAETDFTLEPERYDLLFDVPGTRPLSQLLRVLKPEGRYVPIGHEGFETSARRLLGLIPRFMRLMLLGRFDRRLRVSGGDWMSKHDAIGMLRDLLADGSVTPLIDSTWPLDDVHEAFRHMMEDELHGKVILVPDGQG